MKKLVLIALGAVFILNESCVSHHHIIMASDLDDTVKTLIKPGMVSVEVNRPWSHRRTWGLMETKDDSLLGMGYVTQVKRGVISSTYRIGTMDTTFAMPNKHFSMQDSILRNRKGEKLEVVRVEPEPCLCEPGIGLVFGRDSVTHNFVPPQKKILEVPLEAVSWTPNKLPQVYAAMIDTIDTSPDGLYSYRLAVRYSDETSCDIFWLTRREWKTDSITTMVYLPSAEHLRYFNEALKPDNEDGRQMTGFSILKDYVEPKKVKKQDHTSRDRK